MDNFALPNDVDVLVIGTGLVQSIVAAAASRTGKIVLHIDNKGHYGGDWGSYHLESLSQFNETNENSTQNSENPLYCGSKSQIMELSTTWHIPEKSSEEDSWSRDKLLAKMNKFNIDMAPKLHFANGDLVNLLISSNIARYLEFRSVSRIMTYSEGELVVIPCSREAIFVSNQLSLVEKRMLMKLLTSVMSDGSQEIGSPDMSFKEALESQKLTPRCIHYIIHGIAMTTVNDSVENGIKCMKRFLKSIGRFGKTPFLYSMWGSAEIPQAFCRISAVFGGTYALSQPLNEFKYDAEGNIASITCGEQEIRTKKCIMGLGSKICDRNLEKRENLVSRAILLTDSSLLKDDSEHLTLLLFPSEDGTELCKIIEAGSRTGTTIEGLYLVYLFKKQSMTPEDDLKYYVDKLYGDDLSPKILWSCYFTAPNCESFERFGNNGFLCPGPDIDLDYDNSIKQAKLIYETMYPDDAFLPRAPDPEEIIIGDENDVEDEKEDVLQGDN